LLPLRQHFETFDPARPLHPFRQQAWERFNQQGHSTTKDERYKYTSLTDRFAAYCQASPGAAPCPIRYPDYGLDAYHVVLVDGQRHDAHTQLAGHERFMQILTLEEAYQQHPQLVAQHWGQHASRPADPWVALNTALFEQGLLIRIQEHAIVDKPLVIHAFTTADTPFATAYPRLLVIAEAHSQVSLLHAWQGSGWTNAVTEIVVNERAHVDYCSLQTHLNPQAHLVNTVQCTQAQHSTLHTHTLTWSGALVRNNLDCTMDGPHSALHMYGLYALQGQQHVDNCTTVDHRQPHTVSHEHYKGIVTEAATGVFNGSIYVQPAAQKTKAFQQNNNLLLSEQATLHTKPQLEIWADDVKCSHGATTGQLDPAQLFYLRSRGIPAAGAQSLLRQAFAHEMIDQIPLKALREYVYQALPV